jgi:hypothetical protein
VGATYLSSEFRFPLSMELRLPPMEERLPPPVELRLLPMELRFACPPSTPRQSVTVHTRGAGGRSSSLSPVAR